MKILIIVEIAIVIWILGFYFHFIPVPRPKIYQYFTVALIGVVQPLAIYWTIKRNFNSSNHLRELLGVSVTNKELRISGESFYLELLWDKIFKISDTPKYILIYQNNLSAIIISKKDLSETELREFKVILRQIPKFPIHLK